MENKILVTGAAGSIGSNAVKRLLELRFPVRALVRKMDDRSDLLAALGAEVVLGDLTDFMSVSAAMKGISKVLFVYPIAPGLVEAADYIAQSALEENVKFIVNISQRTAVRDASSHSAQSSWLAERLLDRSGVAVTHLQPTLFTDWLKYFAQTIKGNNMFITPFGDTKFGMIDTEDIAYVAAAILADPKEHVGQTYQLYRPEEINGFDAAEILSAALKRKIVFANLTPEAFGDILIQNGQPSYSTKHLVAVGHMFRSGGFHGMNDNVEKLSGRKPLTAKEFIDRNISLYI